MTITEMFHVTDTKHYANIKRHGIVPNFNRKTKHGEFVTWLISTEEEAKRIYVLKTFSENNPIETPIIVKVDARRVKLYKFGNMKDYYTTDLIGPDKIIAFKILGVDQWLS